MKEQAINTQAGGTDGDRTTSRPSPLKVLAPETPSEDRSQLKLEQVRERLGGKSGKHFWRSLDELAQSDEFQELIHREFPRQAAAEDGVSRRRFLQLSGATLALAGLTGCTKQPSEHLVPYVRQPEEIIPGKPLFFASTVTAQPGGHATGVLVESHMGRPTKIEGNPEHPASLGATDQVAQASILEMYDPDRSKAVAHLGRQGTWERFGQVLRQALVAQEALEGAGLRILMESTTSPTLAAQLDAFEATFPQAKVVTWDAGGPHAAALGTQRAYGQWLETRYDLAAAEVVVTLDSDLLGSGPAAVRYARDFARRRKVVDGVEMNRLYAVESTPTPTGSLADHRLPLAPAAIGRFALALAARLGVGGVTAPALEDEELERWVAAVATDLGAHRGASLVVAGAHASPALHVLAHALNDALGNVGTTVFHTDPVAARPGDQLAELRQLVADMEAGQVDVLLVFGTNPVFTAPADLGFEAAFRKVALRAHHGLYVDETAELCQWHVPATHFLEGWSDARAFDGTASIVQPLIEPLYEGRTVHEVLALLTGQGGVPSYELVQETWKAAYTGADFEGYWRRTLHDGLALDSALPEKTVALAGGAVAEAAGQLAAAPEGLELSLRPDPNISDGRFANNGWLQELPKPITLLTWDNALLISPAAVERLGLAGEPTRNRFLPEQLHGEAARVGHLMTASGKMVRLSAGDRSIEVPLWVVPGQAEDAVTLHFGYGRRTSGQVGTDTGFDAYPLRTSESPWGAAGVTLEATGETYPLASTQLHNNIPLEGEEAEKRHLVRTASVEQFRANPKLVEEMGHAEMAKLSLYPGYEYDGHAWGMAIDLSSCMGCSACVVACQAENNIPVVGKERVANGREMHWLRIDRYFAGDDLENPEVHHQPIPCMQCEQAPCEVVCPVTATVHNEEGLNDMVYNRCVGTRYCSNNCPYKVRRFNFFKYNDDDPVAAMGRNPDVTVRFRGVMEKCTYCVQRINAARIDSKVKGEPLTDGTIKTACQQVCPTEAITFGDINDEGSTVRRWKDSPLNYSLLEELGTRPRTTYLAKLTNPNPELERNRDGHH